jgi:hypothetical protein
MKKPPTESDNVPALNAVSPHAERSPTRNCNLHQRIDYLLLRRLAFRGHMEPARDGYHSDWQW